MGRVTVVSKASNASSSSLHPPYLEMVCEAISALKDRTGSSQPAIAKYIESNYNKALPANFKKLLSVQLKKFVKSEKLVKVKNSYKISSTEKETMKRKGTAAKNIGSTPKKEVAKKVPVKGSKTKRLSQVKTPDALKKATKKEVKKAVSSPKAKRSSQVKSPEGLKRKGLKSGNKPKVTKKARN